MATMLVRRFAVVLGAAAAFGVGLSGVALAATGRFDMLFLVLPLGGAVMALVIAAAHSLQGPSLSTPDAFRRDLFTFDVMNVSRVRVAGIGGLGLVLASLAIVLQFRLLTAAYALGFLGGLACAAILIAHRRAHPGAGQPGHLL